MNTRNELLDAAERASRAKGFDAFSYADLSEAVGIRKASIHHHFPTKADLALAVIERYSETFFAHLGVIAAKRGTAASKLRAYVKTYREALSGGETVCLCVAFSAGRDSLAAPVLAQLNAFHEKSLDWLAARFNEAREDGSIADVETPKQEAAACLALMEGAQLTARAARDVAMFDNAVRLLTRRLK